MVGEEEMGRTVWTLVFMQEAEGVAELVCWERQWDTLSREEVMCVPKSASMMFLTSNCT
jgi:hypothetical protein